MVTSISSSHLSSAPVSSVPATAQPAAKQTAANQSAKGSSLPQDKVSLSGQGQNAAAAKGTAGPRASDTDD